MDRMVAELKAFHEQGAVASGKKQACKVSQK